MPKLIASCHCGGTRIELPETPHSATECNCSWCSKSGGLWAYYPPAAPVVLSDAFGAVYSATGLNQHHFCSRCGCQTYGVSPDWSAADIGGNSVPKGKKFAINVRIVDGLELAALEIVRIDGRNLW